MMICRSVPWFFLAFSVFSADGFSPSSLQLRWVQCKCKSSRRMPSSAAKLTQPMRLSAVIDPSLLLTPSSLFSLGLATAFTPCSLGMIPLTVTYLTNEDVVVSGKEEATPDVIPSFLFALGLTLAYICSGTVLLLGLSVPSQQLQIQGLGKGISAAITAAAGNGFNCWCN